MDREAELAAVSEFIATRGVSRCPARYGGEARAALPIAQEAERIAAPQ